MENIISDCYDCCGQKPIIPDTLHVTISHGDGRKTTVDIPNPLPLPDECSSLNCFPDLMRNAVLSYLVKQGHLQIEELL